MAGHTRYHDYWSAGDKADLIAAYAEGAPVNHRTTFSEVMNILGEEGKTQTEIDAWFAEWHDVSITDNVPSTSDII